MSPRPPKVVTLDFESKPIKPRPYYPPEPVGFSILFPGDKHSRYYAWAHPCENNCTKKQAQAVLKDAWKCEYPLLFQNAKFDVDVAQTHMGMGKIAWHNIHDTLYLLFLRNPHAKSHSLKPAAAEILGMPPEEQEAVRDWLMAHQDELKCEGLLPIDVTLCESPGAKPSPSGEPRYWAAWIGLAPGKLVGAYADGDTIRTLKLFNKVWPEICDRGMKLAYDRERELMPPLLDNERHGVCADLELLQSDTAQFTEAAIMVDRWMRKTLKSKDLNVDSDDDLARALIASGKADEALFERTEKAGKLSASKDSLLGAVTDRRVMNVLQYRSMLMTRLKTFLRPWCDEATASNGIVHPSWNQVKQYGGASEKGARTGRLSASRFMNTPASVGTSQHDSMATVMFKHPDFIKGLPVLPACRKYLLPDKGQVWMKRDFCQQELRILAHFEDGVLMGQYKENPKLDVHTFACELIERDYGVKVGRTRTKTIGFSLLYGMGEGELANRLELPVDEARSLKKMYLSIFPGLKALQGDLKDLAKAGQPLRTWGGREYYCEEPKVIKGRLRTFEYKLLNYLIQGSAADCTKQAIINYANSPHEARFLITVHDEVNCSVEPRLLQKEMRILRDAMADVAFDVKMLSDGKMGENWGALKAYNEEDELCTTVPWK